jgi:hypothetical protein
MIQNDFVEEYRRLETPFDFNYNKYFQNSLGDIILSSNFVIDKNIITFGNTDLGNNIYPENTNFIVDSLTMLSTNPSLANYVPFKFSFSGQKPEIDFSQPDRIEVENYGYIRNNNLGVLTNRFSEIKELEINIPLPPNTGITSLLGCIYGSSGRGTYIVFNDSDDVLYLWYVGLGNGIYTREKTGFILDNMANQVRTWGQDFELVRIDGTSQHTFILIRDKTKPDQNGDVTIYALKDGFAEYNGGRNNYPADIFEPRVLVRRYIASTFTRDYFIYLGQDSPPIGPKQPPEIKILRYNHSYAPNIPPPDIFDPTRYEFVNTYTSSSADVVLLESVVDLAIDRYFINKDIYAVTDSGIILRLTILDNATLEVTQLIQTGLDDCYRINVNINQDLSPSFVVVTRDGFNFSVTPVVNNRTLTTDNYVSNVDVEIKNGLNNIHFYNDDKLYIYNILEGTRFIYDLKDDPRIFSNLPYSFSFGTISRYFNVSFGFDDTQTLEDRKSIKLYYSLNERYGKTSVNKYTFHYNDDRNYLYNIKNNFVFDLLTEQGVEIKDLEIFKIIMDIRIRYTKQKIDPNKAIPRDTSKEIPLDLLELCLEECEDESGETRCQGDGCPQIDPNKAIPRDTSKEIPSKSGETLKDNECKAKCVKRLGGAGRILGYVGEDFSVSDFLNIYTTR